MVVRWDIQILFFLQGYFSSFIPRVFSNHLHKMLHRNFTVLIFPTLYAQSRKGIVSGVSRINPRIQRLTYSNGVSLNNSQSHIDRIKVIMKEYGSVGVAFHITMSLCSVGICYLLVDNGLDVKKVLNYFNVESSVAKKGASTLALAYVLHKLLLPVRATITVVSVPIIVRQLRLRGWMKGPLPKAKSTKK